LYVILTLQLLKKKIFWAKNRCVTGDSTVMRGTIIDIW
jgi:hypothetical protein